MRNEPLSSLFQGSQIRPDPKNTNKKTSCFSNLLISITKP